MRGEARAPATLSNIGPGFDVLGLALDAPADRVVAEWRTASGMSVTPSGPFGDRIPRDTTKNVACYAAERVLSLSGAGGGLDLVVEKQIPPGSGLGSSAASSVAAAVATARALKMPLDPALLLPIVRDAEKLAAGSAHLDNVAPALLGGFVAVVTTDPPSVRSLAFPADWWLAVVLPEYVVETRQARAVLPAQVPLGDAIANLRDLAAVIDAAARGDLATFAAHLADRLAAPYRMPLWPFLDPARRAAIAAGAAAWLISGSGPAMFAPCAARGDAERVVEAVVVALATAGFRAQSYVARGASAGAMELRL